MPWLCTPITKRVSHAGKTFRAHLRHAHHFSHHGARAVWRTGLACVFIGPPLALFGIPVWRAMPEIGAAIPSPVEDVPHAIPEPSALVLLGAACLMLMVLRSALRKV